MKCFFAAPKSKAIPGVVELKDKIEEQPAKPNVEPDKPGLKPANLIDSVDPVGQDGGKVEKLEYLGLKLVKSNGDNWTKQESSSKSDSKPVKPESKPVKPDSKPVKPKLESKQVKHDSKPAKAETPIPSSPGIYYFKLSKLS